MDFKSELQKLAIQIRERKEHVSNEEMTKQVLIIPLIQKLGYDVFNPLEVKAEYVADFGQKKSEKVDYAVYKDGQPIFFIEAKPVTEKLEKHSSQLARYFNSTPNVKVAILTNGLEYKFYTDLKQENIMDDEPFLSFNIENLTPTDYEALESFRKEKFDATAITRFAEELVYMSNLNATLKELFRNPSDDFLRFLIKDFSNTRITSNVLERFRPIVKKAISNTLLEIISEGLFQTGGQSEAAVATQEEEASVESIPLKKEIVTTEEELRAFEIVVDILTKNKRDVSQVAHKDTLSYFTIYKRVITGWMFRLSLDRNQKTLITRIEVNKAKQLCPGFKVTEAPKNNGVSRIQLDSVEDLNKLQTLILLSYDEIQ